MRRCGTTPVTLSPARVAILSPLRPLLPDLPVFPESPHKVARVTGRYSPERGHVARARRAAVAAPARRDRGTGRMNQQLIDRIQQCPNLPSLPTIAMQVLELAKKSDVDIAEIARLICKDPALSSKILRTVNSSFYGRSQHVSTISHALVILGLQSVKTLVLGFSLVSNLSDTKSKGFKHIAYWRRSIFAATAARTIAAKIGVVQQEEAFLTALLMDIGMLVLDLVVGEPYGEIHGKIAGHEELAAAERQELGMSHADVAGVLAAQWKLPP